jgi:hypothetical protein
MRSRNVALPGALRMASMFPEVGTSRGILSSGGETSALIWAGDVSRFAENGLGIENDSGGDKEDLKPIALINHDPDQTDS